MLFRSGSTVVLATGGHITPLANDTLRERKISVIRDQLDVDIEALAPRANIRTVALGGDHGSLAMKAAILKHLREQGRAVDDLGTHSTDPVDYPDTAAAVAVQVARGEADAGIVIDGAGLGSAIAANKVQGVRAAMCTDRTLARYAREHNGANVLSLGATLVSIPTALEIVDVFIGTAMREPRYIRRLAKLKDLERRSRV